MNKIVENSVVVHGNSVSWVVQRNRDHLLAAWIGVVASQFVIVALASLITWELQYAIVICMLGIGVIQIANLIRATFFAQQEKLDFAGPDLVFSQTFPYFALVDADPITSIRNALFMKRKFAFSKELVRTVKIGQNDMGNVLEVVLRTGESSVLVFGDVASLTYILKELEKFGWV